MWAGVAIAALFPPSEQVVKGRIVTGPPRGTVLLMRVDRVSPQCTVVSTARCHILCPHWMLTHIQEQILLLHHLGFNIELKSRPVDLIELCFSLFGAFKAEKLTFP